MSLLDLLQPDTECADYGEAPRYWSHQEVSVEVHRVAEEYEGVIRIRGYVVARVGPDTAQRVERDLERTLLTLRPELREKLQVPQSKSALQRILDEVD